MKTTFTIANEFAGELENQLSEMDLLQQVTDIKEGDFWTNFVLEDITDEEEALIHDEIAFITEF
jgi:hypothetical protein